MRSLAQGMFYGLAALAAGVVLLFAGASMNGGDVMCGSQVMERDDVCQVLEEGGAERTYEQQEAQVRSSGMWMLAGGGAMILVGAGFAVAGVVAKRRASSAPVAYPPGR